MKRPLPLILSAISVLALAAPAEEKPHPAEVRTARPQAEQLKGAAKATTLMGMTVKNKLEETLGKVTDLVLDMESGGIVAVIVATGSFLGTGDELSAVPSAELRMNPCGDAFQLGAAKALLRNAPHFKPDQWPDFTHTGYVGGKCRAHQLQPYFTTGRDNTMRHVNARDGQELTPFDQSGSKDEVATTAQIRGEIMSGKFLSMHAQNVKVSTLNGRVTLRGTVNEVSKKSFMEALATRLVGSRNVDSQI